ncbi:DUF1573 domain-containing protein [Labilibaculum sp. A4]|uniref:DUF1573 domain-containing protein n=1 Tax=Labilibaculum manganireducens TaxID=1940525 RepID=A0A2N3HUE9_9BACT|nr:MULTISPECIES: DUF1573 domain-containing protein [Labilibaculum]MDQ1771351.1 DUF1573 domain-containing protein [Labilibaculum euxinus]MWN77139.1 DUF1573 domain-containing protein [Labilibaculum euxinus]PKQ61667.1 hypothetical protein BZG01_18840 [Labilibaculum manganireducens]
MSRKVFYLLVVAILGSTLSVSAQDAAPVMKFDTKEYDFKTFKEEDGLTSYSFEFINTGNQPVIINQVRSSCGCTSPEWSKEPVAPGQKGFVKATFDPKNRPGPFNKSITITANTNPAITILRISGNVIAREKTVADLYPREMDGLRLQNNHLSFTKVKNTEVKDASMEVYNDSDKPISIGFKRVPAHLSLKMVPETLQPKQKGQIIATYDASKKNDWGFVIDYLDVLINQEYKSGNRLTVSANLVEDFSSLSKSELANSPKVEFVKDVFDFGELTQGEKAEYSFTMKNMGKSDLIIRKTKASCGCTAIAPSTKIVKAGEASEIKVVFNSRGKRGRQNKMITVITNDPVDSEVKLRISGNVVMPKTN